MQGRSAARPGILLSFFHFCTAEKAQGLGELNPSLAEELCGFFFLIKSEILIMLSA